MNRALGSLAAGATATVNVTVKAMVRKTQFDNMATVTTDAATNDSDSSNNSATVTVQSK